jgi:hypothetical protein
MGFEDIMMKVERVPAFFHHRAHGEHREKPLNISVNSVFSVVK